MNRKFVLVALPAIFAAVFFLLTGAPEDESASVESLGAGKAAQSNISQPGLVDSLDNAQGFENFGPDDGERSFHSDIEFFETALSYGTNTDPRVTFLLVNAYINANQQIYGIAYFERLLKRYRNTMDESVRAPYLAAYAILRATYADHVPLLSRIGWMYDTFSLLEEADALSDGQDPFVHWSAGLVYAQVPFFFFKKEKAYTELNWLLERPGSEPFFGFYREAYRHLAKLHASDGNRELAENFLKKSGFDDHQPEAMFMGWFTSSQKAGATMADAHTLKEVVPGRVYSLYGFGFSDIHFVVSKNGKELIAIDAGTRPDSVQAAHEFLKRHRPNLPPLSTLLVTHAHWDHIGGYTYFKKISPGLKIYGRENFEATIERSNRNHSYTSFRGGGFQHEWMEDYSPDVSVANRSTIAIGGTPIELIPTAGGETEDALFIFMPELDAMFVGDFLMPYFGEPWVEEGSIDGAQAAMREVIKRNPRHVIHGHQPLTVLYQAPSIQKFLDGYTWLVEATREHIRNGYSVKEIIRLNLIPPSLYGNPDAFVPYMDPRDHIIARVGDNMNGYWHEDSTGQEPAGLDTLTAVEYGRLLEKYLGLSAREVGAALRKAIDGGDNELALQMAVAAEKRFPGDSEIALLKRKAADRLRSGVQFLDPFKFTVYSEIAGTALKPMPVPRIIVSEEPENRAGGDQGGGS